MKTLKQILIIAIAITSLFVVGITYQQNKHLKTEIEVLHNLIDLKNEVIDSLDFRLGKYEIIENITITMYNPTIEQCDVDPHITADGSIIDIENASNHKWIAVSQDLLVYNGGPFKYGDKVILVSKKHKIIGTYEVRDTMNPKWIQRADILETEGTPLYRHDDAIIVKLV